MSDKNSTDSIAHTPPVERETSNRELEEISKDFGKYCPRACPQEMLPW